MSDVSESYKANSSGLAINADCHYRGGYSNEPCWGQVEWVKRHDTHVRQAYGHVCRGHAECLVGKPYTPEPEPKPSRGVSPIHAILADIVKTMKAKSPSYNPHAEGFILTDCHRLGEKTDHPCWGEVVVTSDETALCEGHQGAIYTPEPKPKPLTKTSPSYKPADVGGDMIRQCHRIGEKAGEPCYGKVWRHDGYLVTYRCQGHAAEGTYRPEPIKPASPIAPTFGYTRSEPISTADWLRREAEQTKPAVAVDKAAPGKDKSLAKPSNGWVDGKVVDNVIVWMDGFSPPITLGIKKDVPCSS